MAPKPVILLGKEKDFFDVRGLEEAYGRLQRLYSLLGAKDNIGLFVGPTYHGYTKENREAMYGWFNRVTGISHSSAEPDLVMEKEATLNCTPTGSVLDMNSRRVFSFTSELSKSLATRRERRSSEALARVVAARLKLGPRKTADYRILRPYPSRGYPTKNAIAYAVETEPGIEAIVYRLTEEPLYSRPPKGQRRAVLYVSHHSSDAELRDDAFVRELAKAEADAAFFSCDVRGIGESQPDTCGPNSFQTAYGSDYFYAIHSVMLDRPYLGQRTQDVLSVVDWLRAQGHTEVHLAGQGWGALPATFAGLLSPAVVQVTLKHALTSYSAVAESEIYHWPLALLPYGVLADFDLPDCYRALEAKKLRQVEPWGPEAA